MVRELIFSFIIAGSIAISALGQQGEQVNFDVSGNVRDQKGVAIPNAKVIFDREGIRSKTSTVTDINGEFEISLFHGDYSIQIEGFPTSEHLKFLKVGKDVSTRTIELLVESSALLTQIPVDHPKVEHFVLPEVPPAAVAVRATGVVRVEAQLSTTGNVKAASVLEGHPLLKAVDVQAVRKWTFEPSAEDRIVVITLVFMPWRERKEGVLIAPDPYRHFIVGPRPSVSYTHFIAPSQDALSCVR